MRTESLHRYAPLLLAAALVPLAGCPPVRPPAERNFISADTLASRLGMRLVKETPSYALLQNSYATIQIFVGPKGYIYVNGKPLGPPDNAIYRHDKVWVLASREQLLKIELRRLAPAPAPPPPAPPAPPTARQPIRGTIVVDAGHGGKDPGTQGVSPVPEKRIVLDIAQRLAQALRARGAKVILTRDSDVFIERDDRAAMADRTRCDVFVSIHADSAPRASASGATIYIARNAGVESMRLAQRVDAALRRAGIECNGVRRAGYDVLVKHARPALLIEAGYLTNSGDSSRLNTTAFREKFAEAVADGLGDGLAR